MLAAGSTGLAAQAGSACAAINEGFLNVELGTDQADNNRGVRLQAGDKLSFQFQTSDRSFGSVALLGKDKAERLLLVGPSGTGVDFVAPVSGAFDFRFAKDGIEAASFRVSCLPARLARREARRAGPMRTGMLLPQPSFAEEAGESEAPLVADAAPSPPMNLSEMRPLETAAPKDPDTGFVFKMEPRDTSRMAPGAHLDPATTGMNMGLNYQLQPAIMLGALAQIDQSSAALAAPSSNLAEHGWMLGPTAKLHLGGGLSLDAQAAWGHADSGDIGVAQSGPSLPRRTLSAKLANTQTMGAWRFSPSISVNRSWDTAAVHEAESDIYLTSTVSSGRVDVGPEVAYRMDLANAAFLEPRIAFGSFWGLDGGPELHGHSDMRLKAEAGVTLGVADGTKVQLGGAIEEGTATTPDTWSGRLQMSVPLK